MGIVYQKDKRSGITYVYENKAYWDKEKGQSRAKRTLIGKLDDNGNIVKTDKRNKKYDIVMPESLTACREMIDKLLKENEELKERLAKYEGK